MWLNPEHHRIVSGINAWRKPTQQTEFIKNQNSSVAHWQPFQLAPVDNRLPMPALGHHYPVYINLVMLLPRKSGTAVAISKMHIGCPFTTLIKTILMVWWKPFLMYRLLKYVKSALMQTGGLVLSKAEIIWYYLAILKENNTENLSNNHKKAPLEIAEWSYSEHKIILKWESNHKASVQYNTNLWNTSLIFSSFTSN